MKRLAVGPIIVVVSMLVIVAPASATTVLHGKFAGGNVQSPDPPNLPIPPVALAASGPVNIVVHNALEPVRALSFLIAPLEVMETCPALRIRPFAGLLTPVPTPRRRVARHSISVTARPQPARDRAGGDRSREGRGLLRVLQRGRAA